jgi:hypothetical protein
MTNERLARSTTSMDRDYELDGAQSREQISDQEREHEPLSPNPDAPGAPLPEAAASIGGNTRGTADALSESQGVPLIADQERDSYLGRWMEIQSRFVDSPRDAVTEADGLVSEVIDSLAQGFAVQRSGLERQWETDGDTAETENFRLVLQRYRSFFHRLLAA